MTSESRKTLKNSPKTRGVFYINNDDDPDDDSPLLRNRNKQVQTDISFGHTSSATIIKDEEIRLRLGAVQKKTSRPSTANENNRRTISSMLCESPAILKYFRNFRSLPDVSNLLDLREQFASSSDVGVADQRQPFDFSNRLQKRRQTREKDKFLMAKTYEELINSEVQYLDSLYTMINTYVKPIAQDLAAFDNHEWGHVAKTMAKTLETMHEKNKFFLCQLLKFDKRYHKINSIFVKYESTFDIYPAYVGLYNAYLRVIDLVPDTRDFIKRTEEETDDKLGLRSSLLKPIQRLSKYKLLLENFQRYWPDPEDSSAPPHQGNVDKALKIITDMLQRCDTVTTLQSIRGHVFSWSQTGNALWCSKEDVKLLNDHHSLVRVFVFERVIMFAAKRKGEAAGLRYKGSVLTNKARKFEKEEARCVTVEDYDASKRMGKSVKWVLKFPSREGFRAFVECVEGILWKQLMDQKEMTLERYKDL